MSRQNAQLSRASESFNTVPFNLHGQTTTPNDTQSNINFQGGGGTNKIRGTRRMNVYSDYDTMRGGVDGKTKKKSHPQNKDDDLDTSTSEDDDFDEFIGTFNRTSSRSRNNEPESKKARFKYDIDTDTGGLSRQVESKVDMIHQRTIKKIMEMMGVDELTAKNYKAVLYRRAKTEHPELGSFERATEMEKMATKDNLDEIDIKKVSKEIKEYIEQKQRDREAENTNTNTNTNTKKYDKSDRSDKSDSGKVKRKRSSQKKDGDSDLSATSDL